MRRVRGRAALAGDVIRGRSGSYAPSRDEREETAGRSIEGGEVVETRAGRRDKFAGSVLKTPQPRYDPSDVWEERTGQGG